MTQEFTFKYFINNYTYDEISKFNIVFQGRIGSLPNTVMSSKKIRELIEIKNTSEDILFKQVYLRYFKEKLYYSDQ